MPVGAGMAGQTSLNKSKRASGKTQFLLHELEHQRPGEVAVEGVVWGGGGEQGTCLQAPVSDLQSWILTASDLVTDFTKKHSQRSPELH